MPPSGSAGDELDLRDGQAIVVDGGITAGRPWSENKAMGARIRDALGVMALERR